MSASRSLRRVHGVSPEIIAIYRHGFSREGRDINGKKAVSAVPMRVRYSDRDPTPVQNGDRDRAPKWSPGLCTSEQTERASV